MDKICKISDILSIMIDEKDRLILNELRDNSRNSTKNIALNLHMPRITVHDRIKKLIDKKIIKKFTIVPDYEKLGLTTTVFIFIALNHHESGISIGKIAQQIKKISSVYEIHITAGEYDLLIKAREKTFDDIGKNVIVKIKKIKGVGKTFTCPCFTTIKEII